MKYIKPMSFLRHDVSQLEAVLASIMIKTSKGLKSIV